MIAHSIVSPFPIKRPAGGIITDERCTCGELRSDHADTSLYGQGPCAESHCPKFMWAEFVVVDTSHKPVRPQNRAIRKLRQS